MAKTVLITGCSSGIGKATAQEFQRHGWQVAATMRNPADGADLTALPNLRVIALDVSIKADIERVVRDIEAEWGGIDAVINNAGYGLVGPFETATDEQIRAQFAVNVFGVMDLIRAVLPGMRRRGKGTIVNIGSIGSLLTFPLNSLYHATKFALHGFSSSLAYELAPFGITVKLVAPGGVATDFAGRSLIRTFSDEPGEYHETIDKVIEGFQARMSANASAGEIATEVYRATVDNKSRILYVAGKSGKTIVRLFRFFGAEKFRNIIKRNFHL